MNKLWAFGDSYTYCTGINFTFEKTGVPRPCTLEEEKKWVYTKHPYLKDFLPFTPWDNNKTWPTLLSESLGVEEINFGVPGSANEQVLAKVLSSMSDFTEGDCVVIGTVPGSRLLVPAPGLSSFSDVLSSTAIRLTHEGRFDWFDLTKFDKTKFISMVDYIEKVLTREASNAIEEFYTNMYRDLVSYLESKGVNCLIWNSELRGSYETIVESTNGVCKDYHWSPNGCKEVAKDFYGILKNKVVTLK